jgi:hypothetical protein
MLSADSYQQTAVLSILLKLPSREGLGVCLLVNQVFFFSFSLIKKKQKIKTWDFRPSTSGSLPKTQKLGLRLKQFEFLHGSFT